MSFSFGTPSSAPVTGLSTGFSFGANKPATPGFGLSTTTQSTGVFGTPATSTTGFGTTPAFGAAAPAFGAATPAFGPTSAAPAFGATATPSFGATSAAPAFGATTPAFGATATPAFGATTTPAFGAATSAPAFGATTTPAFGSAAPSFGAATSQPALGGGGVGGLNFGANTSTSTAGGLNFGAPAATSAPGLGGLGGFGLGASTAATGGFGLLGSSTTTTSGLFGARLGTTPATGTQPTHSTTPSVGLGGVAPSAGGAHAAATGDGKNEPAKQSKLPNEVSATVDAFKEFVKKQKAMSADIMRVSIKPLHQVSVSAESLQRAVQSALSSVQRSRAGAGRLRARTAATAAAADQARHTPPGSELESAPPQYVAELVAELETQLAALRRQVEAADQLMQTEHTVLTQEELSLGIRRMHTAMVGLATRLQAVHVQTRKQLDLYRKLRTNSRTQVDSELDELLTSAEPRKKPKGSLAAALDPAAAIGGSQQLAGPTPFSYFNTLSPFPCDVTGSSWHAATPAATTAAPFTLQRAPNKRGKQ